MTNKGWYAIKPNQPINWNQATYQETWKNLNKIIETKCVCII